MSSTTSKQTKELGNKLDILEKKLETTSWQTKGLEQKLETTSKELGNKLVELERKLDNKLEEILKLLKRK